MLALLYQPLPPGRIVLLTLAAIAAVTVYCLAHTTLSGGAESPLDGVIWASVYVAPFLLAFEALKRAKGLAAQAVILAAAIAASVGLQALAYAVSSFTFEMVQRLPAAGLALALAWTGGLLAARRARATAAAQPAELPLAPGLIDWVAAAGNYVELHAGGRTILHRAPLAAVETALAPYGFVRIHRSRLVSRQAVARLRSVDVVLHDGTSLKIGSRYRAGLTAAVGQG